MNSIATYQREWFGNARSDVLSGLIVALALIPEAVGFSIIAGVDPKVGLYSSFIIPIVAAFLGGRPAMISAATGAMALLMTGIVKEYGLGVLFATTIMAGVWQIAFGYLRLSRYLKFIPRSVMVGFVNALAVLIFYAQLPQFVGAGWTMYALVALGLGIIYLLPRITKIVPSPLVAIVLLTIIVVAFHINVRHVGDMGALPTSFPSFGIPHFAINSDVVRTILSTSLTLALVGLIESLLTSRLVDQRTDTSSDKNAECRSQGISNVIAGLFGGMAGCAMIGQTMINVNFGGRGRLSTFLAGAFLLALMLAFQQVLFFVPMAALVAVMIVVAINTFDWSSLRTLAAYPKSDTIAMLATVAATLATRDLSIGVLVGVLLSAIFFARKVAKLARVTSVRDTGTASRTYVVCGQVFFASTTEFVAAFDTTEALERVTIDLSHAHLWDGSAVDAVDTVSAAFRRRGIRVHLTGLNEASTDLFARVGVERLADLST